MFIFFKAPRSGLAWKNHIDVGAGVIDEDYRGEGNYFIFYNFKYSWCYFIQPFRKTF